VAAPLAGLTRGSVSLIVRRACVRAGVTPIGAHRLRHTVACEMLAAGAPLPEIGQLLRHHDMSSTALYADSRELHQTGAGIGLSPQLAA
jgi:integrase/recombinase XerD